MRPKFGAEEAKKRQGQRNDLLPNIPQLVAGSSETGEAREQAVQLLNINRQYVSDAQAIAHAVHRIKKTRPMSGLLGVTVLSLP